MPFSVSSIQVTFYPANPRCRHTETSATFNTTTTLCSPLSAEVVTVMFTVTMHPTSPPNSIAPNLSSDTASSTKMYLPRPPEALPRLYALKFFVVTRGEEVGIYAKW